MNATKTRTKINLLIAALVALMALSFVAAGTIRHDKAYAATELQTIYLGYLQDSGYNILQSYVPGTDLTDCDFSALANAKLKKLGTDIEYKLSDLGDANFPNCLQQNQYANGNHGINFLIPITETIPNLFGYTLEITESIQLSSEYTLLPFEFKVGILEVANVFAWSGSQSSMTVLMDINNPNWDYFGWDANGPTFVLTESPNVHPYFTVNGIRYNSAAGAYYTFEEYPGLNLYLQLAAFGGPIQGYPSETVICLFFLYDIGGSGEKNIPEDTVAVIDGPIFNYLGEPYLKETVTYQKVSNDWHKVSGITLTAPAKTVYAPNEALDTTGAKINITYADGTTARAIDYADALTNTEIEGFDSSVPGDYTAYVNYHGVKLPFDYTVEAPLGDIFASNFAYAGTATAHNVNINLTAEITAEQAGTLAAALTVAGDGRSVSAITGATVSVSGTAITVSIPKSEIADFYGKGIKLAEDCEIAEGSTVKPFEQTFGGSVLSLTNGVLFPNFSEGTWQLSLISLAGNPLNGNVADFSLIADAVEIIGGEQPVSFSSVEGAYIEYPGDGYLWFWVPASAYPSFEGYGLQLTESATLPSLDKLAPFKYLVYGGSIYAETYIESVARQGNAGIRFNIHIPGGGYTTDLGDFGTDGSSLHANLTINGQKNRFTFVEYPGMTIWISGQGLGAAAWGLGDGDTYCVIGFSYEEQVYGEAGVRNFVEGTLVTLGKNYSINGYMLDRDYTYQLVNDGGVLTWKEVSSVTVTAPVKTNYLVSETLDTTGIKVTVNYIDSTSNVYDYGNYFSIEGFDNINAGEDKTAYVNYRGVKLPFNYTVERVAGEINAVSLSYTSDAYNHYVTVGLNDELPAIDYSALASYVKIGETPVSDIEGATLSYENEAFVITISKTSYAFTGSFAVSVAEDYELLEGTTLKAFEYTYETSVMSVAPGGFFPNFQDGGYHIALIGISGDPVKSGYSDFSALADAIKIVSGNESVSVSAKGGYINYSFDPSLGHYLWIYIPVTDYPSFDGCYITLGENVLTPSLDLLPAFNFVVYGSSILTETHIAETVLHPATQDVLTANIRFGIYMPGHGNDALFDLGVDGHSLHDNLTINGQKTRFTFAEYPGIVFWLGSQSLGSVPHGGEQDVIWVLLFLYGANGEGPRNFPEGTIITLGKNFVLNGFVLDRDYTYQLVTENGVPAWKEVTSVTLTDSAIPFYAVGEELDVHDVKVNVAYADGTTKTYDPSYDASVSLSGFDSTAVGEGTVTFNYHGYNFSFDYSVKEITGYTVVSEPAKTTYKVGEIINLNGMAVNIDFGDDYRAVNFGSGELPAGFTVTGFDSSEPNAALELSVCHNGEPIATFTVQILAPIVESITVTAPVKTSYYIGDELVLTGGHLVAYYDTGIYGDEIALDAEGVTVTGFNSAAAGTVTVTVTYEGVSDTFEVTVNAITITYVSGTAPVSAVYNKGEDNLVIEGGYFTVYYNNGSSETFDFTDEHVTFEFDRSVDAEIVEITAFYGNYSCVFTADVEIEEIADEIGCFSGIATSVPAFLFVLAAAAIGVAKKSEKR
ncbi:MAG: bacterial Ig-like domain-containing protein [Clostridia bacterium]|nr:bacterial Ig-like domain-containing protein [Clostridia bacterium]